MPLVRFLSRSDIEQLGIPVADVIADLESAFAAKGRGEVEMPPKPGIHPRPDAFIHAMPAYVRSRDLAGVKWIAGYPDNPSRGLPYVTGLMILNDPATGLPVAVMDATWVVRPEWLRPGALLCTLDFDASVTPAAFAAADLLCSDDLAQLDFYRLDGYFRGVPDRVVDLGEIVAGRARGRERPDARIITINLGLALEDVVTAHRVLQVAQAAGVGRDLDL